MTIETKTNRVQYVGNGAATDFPVPFPVLRPEHLRLFLWQNGRQTEMTTGFAVVGAGTGSVSVRTDVPVAAGVKLTILREVPLTQMMDLQNGGDFNAETLEGMADILEMQIQQQDEKAGRAIVAPESMGANEVTYETLAGLKEEAVGARDQAQTAAGTAALDAARAEDAAAEIQNLQATATSLAPGDEAAADYDPATGILIFGIPKGRQGDAGKDGTGVNILDAFDDVSELPATGSPGDAYMVGEDLYIWSAADGAWKNAGPIRGPVGAPGKDGDPGPPGPQGEPGQDGSGGFNTREVITASGTFTAPAGGWYRVVCIGGGGPGGAGGTTNGRGGGGGGGAGEVKEEFVFLDAGAVVSCVVGASGGETSFGGELTASPGGAGGSSSTTNNGAPGGDSLSAVGTNGLAGYGSGSSSLGGSGGTGGSNGTSYGGGGGGGGSKGADNGIGGKGGCGAGDGATPPDSYAGGDGGPGAIILEYYDPLI